MRGAGLDDAPRAHIGFAPSLKIDRERIQIVLDALRRGKPLEKQSLGSSEYVLEAIFVHECSMRRISPGVRTGASTIPGLRSFPHTIEDAGQVRDAAREQSPRSKAE